MASILARLFAHLEPTPAYVPARLRIPRRPLRRRVIDL